MEPLLLVSFAFCAGLTVCGLGASTLELLAGRRVGFCEPFVSRRHVLRSLLATAAAGPFMLGNEALAAWRDYQLSPMMAACCVAVAFAWSLAAGVVAVALALRVAALLS